MFQVVKRLAWTSLAALVLTSDPALAQSSQMQVGPPIIESGRATATGAKSRAADPLVSVIVKYEAPALASYEGQISGLGATSPKVTGRRLDPTSRNSTAYLAYLDRERARVVASAAAIAPGARLVHDLPVVMGGVSMVVPRSQLDALRGLPGVAGVYEDTVERLDTYRSVQFIGGPVAWAQLGGQSSAGEGIVVGILDSGVWPENPSFSDPDPAGKSYAAPPASWAGGACDFGGTGGPADAAFACNHKLIGARRFMSTYESVVGLQPYEFRSARDDDGHGTQRHRQPPATATCWRQSPASRSASCRASHRAHTSPSTRSAASRAATGATRPPLCSGRSSTAST